MRGDESSVIVVKDIRRQPWGKHTTLGRWDFIAFEMGHLRRFLSMRIIRSGRCFGNENQCEVWRVN